MTELVEIFAKALVDNPEAVNVEMIEDEIGYRIELRVAPEDMGKIIGRQGRIIRSLRTVVKAAAVKQQVKVTLEVI